jgi:hypothetical protein
MEKPKPIGLGWDEPCIEEKTTFCRVWGIGIGDKDFIRVEKTKSIYEERGEAYFKRKVWICYFSA